MSVETNGVIRIAIAALGGLAIGLERQWSGHASGPSARIGGIRTFTLLGGLAAAAGWLWTVGASALAAVLLAGAVGIVIAGYVAVSGRDVEGTTEVAALVTVAAGTLAGLGYLALGSGVIAVTALLLVEKTRLHRTVEKLDDTGIRAGIRFAVMAAVVLPLLPEGPFGPLGGVRPRLLWLLVLFFSGMSFVGYIARRAVGQMHGYALAGLLGGLVSSTNITFAFSRESREDPSLSGALALGILAACAVLFLRVAVSAAVLNTSLMVAVLPYLAAPFLVAAALVLVGWKRAQASRGEEAGEPSNPLHLRSALQMAALFQIVLFAVYLATKHWGDSGLLASGAILGLTDMDALTISMARTASDPALVRTAAQAVALGVISNTLFKAGAAALIGRGAVRTLVPLGLAATVAAIGASLYFFH
ncbi:MAG TPA: MgtC/SapB family protein [Candidatus Eisenbacteria bacterium]|jgi:uncharacterized membrane protein (DUF4010 family)|nr:MgtC/SapB family protein [Candidatus Eisenbacteria bacterium]